MRTAVSALLVILALVVAAVAGPALWLQKNVIDQAGFVQLAGPLGSNKSFQEGLSALAASQATASVDLPPQLTDLAAALIQSAAQSIYTEPGYDAAWTETLKRSHALTFAAAGNKDIQGDLQLDIAPLVALVAAKVSDSTSVPLATPKDVVVALEQPELARLLPAATTLGGWAGWMAFIAVDLLVLALVAARRRSLTLILAAAGLATVALVWLFASGVVQSVLTGMATGPAAAQQFGVELGALARESWQGGINATFVIAGVLALAGVATLIIKRRRTT
ncbi:hypothetical protein SAMN04489740_3894 [Arthrobacter alpinus]|uniref:Uncharacterized protein n=1 Tax=Arthrobacter alpinus TaxID=656366 RepID=A0A1H5NP42_9MICC|nr:hypothetical protein [Arthrobacter alpinus]SEF03355.1 hypothetical protein SAMN04489740_3894 [Arthrobacter alpinus]